MKKGQLRLFIFSIMIPFFLISINIANAEPQNPLGKDIFGPVASGPWYEPKEEDLKRAVDSFLAKANIKESEKKIVAVIAPHAGYRWSGKCAAYAFKPITKQKFERVLILAPSHTAYFRGLSILKADYYRTPLGLVKIDTDACENLLKEELINTVTRAYTKEHSLEIMLPFLQRTLDDFKLIPIIVGQLSINDYETLANIIKKEIDENTLIVVSSDFTHYGPNYSYVPFPLDENTRQNIENLDKGAIDRIINIDFDEYQKYLTKTEATICGRNPIGLLLKILPKDTKGELVHYYTLGDITGDYENSVSYAAIIFFNK
jgi:AmmeMemoRadiSam system protein B